MLASPAPAHANMRFKIGSWLGFIPSIKMGLEDFSLYREEKRILQQYLQLTFEDVKKNGCFFSLHRLDIDKLMSYIYI